MKPLATLLLIFLSSISFGQTTYISEEFAIVQDKDGYCNVRSSTDMGNNITGRLENGSIVYVYEQQGNWMSVSYSKNNKEYEGYIYNDRLKLVTSYESIPVSANEDYYVTLRKDSVKVKVTKEPFSKSKYRLTYYNNDPKTHVVEINGKQFWGTDGDLPNTAYKSIVISIGTRKTTLPKAAVENLFQPSLHHLRANYDKANDIMYIHSFNSDGAGSYHVIWTIEKGIYKGRYIDHIC